MKRNNDNNNKKCILYILVLLFGLFNIFYDIYLYADDILNIEVRRVADNSTVSNISFGTQDITLSVDDYYSSAQQYIQLIYSFETNNTSWGIRLYTYNSNYLGSAPYGGAIIFPGNNRRLPLLWRIYDSLQPGGVICSNNDDWGDVKDRRDNEWNTAPEIYEIVSGAGKQGELALYPVSGRMISSNIDLYIYLGANCSGSPGLTNNYGTTLYLDLYHELTIPPGLTVNRITPAEGNNSDNQVEITIAGQGFKPGAVVQLNRKGQTDLMAENIQVTATKITADLDLTRIYKTGAWNLKITNPDKEAITVPEAFMVQGYDMTGNKLIPVNNYCNLAAGEQVYIKWSLQQDQTVSLKIYNLNGEVVKTILDNESCRQGQYQFEWNAENDSQKQITSGIYFIRIMGDVFQETHKIVLVR